MNKMFKNVTLKDIQTKIDDARKALSYIESKNKEIEQPAVYIVKEKATFNLSIECLQELEESWAFLRKNIKGHPKISRNLIIELALEEILSDLRENREQSILYKKIKQRNNGKKTSVLLT